MSDTLDLAIIGAGPAGLTAAIYAARARLRTAVYEKGLVGGLAAGTHRIDNFPGFPDGVSGTDLGRLFAAQAERFGATLKTGIVTSADLAGKEKSLIVANETVHARAVIVATGTLPKPLDVPGEAKFRGRGISNCATCDGPFFQDRDVAVIGCGSAGLQEGIFLARYVKSLTFVKRSAAPMRAEKILQERVRQIEKATCYFNHHVLAIEGERSVEAIVIEDQATKEQRRIPVQGIFVYIGLVPQTAFLSGQLKLDEEGYVITGDDLDTNQSGVFAAGDVRHKSLRQVSTAVGDGALAALMAERYLES